MTVRDSSPTLRSRSTSPNRATSKLEIDVLQDSPSTGRRATHRQATPQSEEEEEYTTEAGEFVSDSGSYKYQINEAFTAAMAGPKVREPSLFSGARGEDANDWLTHYEIISAVNGWEPRRLEFSVLYLVGEARSWLEFREPKTWEEFRTRFLREFKREDARYILEAELKKRCQEQNEPVRSYFYSIMSLCKKLEREMGQVMPDTAKLDHLLGGVDRDFFRRLTPMIPESFDDPEKFLAVANRFERIERRARDLSKTGRVEILDQPQHRQPREDSVEGELIQTIKDLQRQIEDIKLEREDQMKSTGSLIRSQPHIAPVRTQYVPQLPKGTYYEDSYGPDGRDDPYPYYEVPSRPPRRFESHRECAEERTPRPDYAKQDRPRNRPAPKHNAEPNQKFQTNRTSDDCRELGHLARHCPVKQQEEQVEPINVLEMIGHSSIKETVLCNGREAVAVISTGTAISAVSEAFPRKLPNNKYKWKGHAVCMVICQEVKPEFGLNIDMVVKGKRLSSKALIMPLPKADLVIGMDILSEFEYMKIVYRGRDTGEWTSS